MMEFRAYAPRALKENKDYEVTYSFGKTEGKLYTATALVNERFTDLTYTTREMSFCSFDADFTEPVTITVKPALKRNTVDVRPASLDISYEFDGDVLTLKVDRPMKFSVEFDGDLYQNLFIFANAPEEKPEGDKVTYFTEESYDLGEIKVKEGETLYIGGDSVVYGYLRAEGKNITITGRGILDGAPYNHDPDLPRQNLANFKDCDGLKVDGVILLDSPGWTFVTRGGKDITVKNLKQICWNHNSDGFDICGSENVLIEDCFIRNWDDSISLKSFGGDNRHIVMRSCTLWADRAHNMLIGPEAKTGAPNTFKDILFEDIDILEHKEFSDEFQGVMAIFCADQAIFEDITWRNIRIERMTYGRIFDFRYVTLFAASVGTSCKNVTMENITCTSPVVFRSRILGLDEEHTFDNIALKNVTYHARPVLEGEPMVEVNEFTSGVTYEV